MSCVQREIPQDDDGGMRMKGRRLDRMFREYALMLKLCSNGWMNVSEEEMRQLSAEMHMFYRICEAVKRYK